jgi:hypothetical protein
MCGGTRRIFECYQRPVLPENHIIAGHGRVEAAKLLGLDCVPTVRLAHLNAAQRRLHRPPPRGLLHRRGTQATSPSITNFPAALAKVPPNNRLFQRVPGTDRIDKNLANCAMISKRVDADWWDMHAEVGLFLVGAGTGLILVALIGLIWPLVPR